MHIKDFNEIRPCFRFQTSDGISRNEEGILKNPGTENEALEVKGRYTYKGPDGKDVTVEFVANENGYQPRVSARRKWTLTPPHTHYWRVPKSG